MKRIIGVLAGVFLLFSLVGCGQASEENVSSAIDSVTSFVSSATNSSDSISSQGNVKSQDNSSDISSLERTQVVKSQKADKKSVKTKGKSNTKKNNVSTKSKVDKNYTSSNSVQNTTSATASEKTEDSFVTVSLSIDCITAVQKGDRVATAVSNNGIMLNNMSVSLKAGATVYDALKFAESQNPSLLVVAENSGLGFYIKSIGSLAEKMVGAESGWQYFVNGVYISQSCDSYILKNGDVIAWRYTCNQGGDLK